MHNIHTCPQCGLSTQERFNMQKGIDGTTSMNPDERELIRSNLYHVDLLLKKLKRKATATIEQANSLEHEAIAKREQAMQMEADIQHLEQLKKPAYLVLKDG